MSDETHVGLAETSARIGSEAMRLRTELERDFPALAQGIAKNFLHRELR